LGFARVDEATTLDDSPMPGSEACERWRRGLILGLFSSVAAHARVNQIRLVASVRGSALAGGGAK
jgi:hypothetical protein